MTIKVNPPPQLRIPQALFDQPDTREYFTRLQFIIFQLWERGGGGDDRLGKLWQVPFNNISESGAILNLNEIYLIDTSSGDVTVTLPTITANNRGQMITVCVVDATNDCYIEPATGQTIFNSADMLMNELWMAFELRALSLTNWGSA